MDIESYENILVNLKAMLKDGPMNKDYGICYNASFCGEGYVGAGYDIIQEEAIGWPQHTGNIHYPIQSNSKHLTESQYYQKHTGTFKELLWRGKQRELRNDLIKYLVEKIGAKVADYKERNQQG